jgi:hypothetical protein
MRWNPSEVHDAIDEAESYIAVLDSNGRLIDEGTDPEETYAKAAHYSPTGTVLVDRNVWASGATPNDAPPTRSEMLRSAERALERSTIQPQYIDYRALGTWGSCSYGNQIKESRALLRSVGEKTYAKMIKESEGTIHQSGTQAVSQKFSPSWIDETVLRENTKTSKVLATSDASYASFGLNLVPHGAAFRSPFSTDTNQGPGGNTFCANSTKECRLTCLVNTGQRAMASGAFAASYLYSQLLLNPETTRAFLINLYDLCVTKMAYSYCREDVRMFLRMNILSDLPWELLAPGLLEAAANSAREYSLPRGGWNWAESLGFYDYTKVPYRAGVKNYYDLTYSYSGRQSRDVAPAIFQGDSTVPRRMAVVFIEREQKLTEAQGRMSYYAADPGARLKKIEQDYFPFEFLGQKVWNGDKTDIRPLDPADVRVVGLAYKVSKYKIWPEAGELNREGKQKEFGVKNFVESADIDHKLPTFMVRVHRPDPKGPLIVMQTQDPTNREIALPLAAEPELKQLTRKRR